MPVRTARLRRLAGGLLSLLLALPWSAPHAGSGTIEPIERFFVAPASPGDVLSPGTSHALVLGVVVLDETGWTVEEVLDAVDGMAAILAPCGIRLRSIDLQRVAVPHEYLDLDTPRSRELARRLAPPRPTFYFVRDTRHRPAFDAEAIGRGNSRTRPELADSVWVTRAAPDLPVVLAHELVHVLANRGDHVDLPDNLMRETSHPDHVRLTGTQCAEVRATGTRHGLLSPLETQ